MSIINSRGIFNLGTAYLRQVGNDWPTAQVISTSDITEGINLYYNNARVYSNVIALLPTLAGSGITIQANGQINSSATLTLASLSPFLTTSNVSEGSNLYYTNARVVSAVLPYLTTSNVSEGSNLYYTNARVNSFIQGNLVLKANVTDLTTANVAELTNLYYTNARVNSFIQGNLATKANVTDLTTANVAELTNLYYTNARVNSFIQGNLVLKANVTDLTTANVAELTNLYYTNTRVYSNVIALLPSLAGSGIAIQANGQISANTQSVSLAGLSTTNLAEGSNLYYTNTRVRTAFTAGKGIRIFADGTIKSVAAGGEYNQSLDGGVAYMVSNVTAGVTFTGATSNDRFILRSMQVTNISNNVAYISSNVLYADGNTGYLGNLITVPQGGFVEFMGRTQIFQPNDSIYFKGFDNNYTPTSNILSAYLTYESVASDISYVGLGRTMANANANVVLVTADVSDFILESIKFVNLKTIDAPVTLYLANATTAVPKAYLAFNMIVPGTSSLEILQSAKLLKVGDALYTSYANSSNADSIAVFTSYRKADATSMSSTTPSVSSTGTASIVFNTTLSEGTTLYYTIE